MYISQAKDSWFNADLRQRRRILQTLLPEYQKGPLNNPYYCLDLGQDVIYVSPSFGGRLWHMDQRDEGLENCLKTESPDIDIETFGYYEENVISKLTGKGALVGLVWGASYSFNTFQGNLIESISTALIWTVGGAIIGRIAGLALDVNKNIYHVRSQAVHPFIKPTLQGSSMFDEIESYLSYAAAKD